MSSLNRFLFFIVPVLLLSNYCAFADIPPGYYSSASGLSGESLQEELHDIIDNHTVRSYDQLWTDFQTIDDIKIDYGKETSVFGGLVSGTIFYFKIYSYIGSGATIDYKLGGTIPQVNLMAN